jgi:excinuclease ABC subunit B
MKKFKVEAPYQPAGDQPGAIKKLTKAIEAGESRVCLRGITGSGKSATIAWTLEKLNRPALLLAPNKSLAAQLHAELSMLLPNNAVEYFVSYYDYYQPEAYVPASDTFIEKESMINDAIDRLRHAATASVLARRDVIVVASVSAIYGLGSPESYKAGVLSFFEGEILKRDELLASLVELGYERNDTALDRGRFRVRGDVLDIWPAGDEFVVRVSFFDEEVEKIDKLDPTTLEVLERVESYHVYPATHYVADKDKTEEACLSIEKELQERLAELKQSGKLLEEQRLRERTRRDVELLRETGRCAGVENYSRHFDKRQAGEPPYTLMDYFPEDLVVILDESHVLIPQISAQQAGDRSRKTTLVEHGFRLPSAIDNRPLSSTEFWNKVKTCIMVSATPGPFEQGESSTKVDLVVRPTGILDPVVEVVSTNGAVADFVARAERIIDTKGRVLATVLTKKMAEDLVTYLIEKGIKAKYMHSDTETLERIEILRDLRLGRFDVLVGINLLREGLDLPEVALVAVFDADREGFLRSATSLIQTIGRAARNIEGRVVLYGDKTTPAMKAAIEETERRRAVQSEYNKKHKITPKTIQKMIHDVPVAGSVAGPVGEKKSGSKHPELPQDPKEAMVEAETLMLRAAENLEFEEAAHWRDVLKKLTSEMGI